MCAVRLSVRGDDLAAIVSQSVLSAAEAEGFELRDRDVIAVNGVPSLPEHRGNYAVSGCNCR